MIRNFLLIAWGNLKHHKLASLLTILTISLGMTLVILMLGIFHSYTGNIGPYQQRNKCLFLTRMSFVINEKEVERSNRHSTKTFINDHLRKLQTPLLVGLYSDGEDVNWDIGSRYNSKPVKYLETDVNFWKIFQFRFIEGRPFIDKEINERQVVCIISRKVALYLFNSTDVIGEYIKRADGNYRVVGVIEDVHPHFDIASDFYVPYTVGLWAEDYSDFDKKLNLDVYSHSGHYKVVVLAKNKSDKSLIKNEFDQLVNKINLSGEVEEFEQVSTSLKSAMQVIPEQHSSDMDDSIFLLIGALVFLVLLIPIVILSNINFYALRRRWLEIGLKKAFGATRKKLFYQFLAENLLITFLGCCVALIIVFPMQKFLSYLIYQTSEFIGIQMDFIFILYLLSGNLIFGFVTGVIPVIRVSKLHPVKAIHSNDSQWDSSFQYKIRKRVLQLSTYLVLYLILALSGSLLITFYASSISPLGYNTKNIIKLAIAETDRNVWEEEYNNDRYKGFKEKLEKVNGVEDVSYVLNQLPFYTDGLGEKTFIINKQEKEMPVVEADTSFFRILKMNAIKGELFNSQNSARYRPAVITKLAEKKYFNKDAVGKIIQLEKSGEEIKIVGLVNKYKPRTFNKEFDGIFLFRNKASRCVLIKFDPETDMTALDKSINQVIENQTSANFHFNSSGTIDDNYSEMYNRVAPMFYGILMVISYLVLNAWFGYFTLTWYNVKSRQLEMGIRRAVGASKNRIRLKILSENIVLMLMGSSVAVALLFQFKSVFFTGYFWESFNSGLIYGLAIAIALTLASTLIPAYVAGRVQVVEALADE